MYAQLFTFTLGPNTGAAAEQIADKSFSAYKSTKGFKSATYLCNYESGEYTGLFIWDSKENFKAAAALLRPQSEKAFASIVKGPPIRKEYEVYKPKP